MINDLDETLKQLLIQTVPLDPREVDISFDLPDRDWAAGLHRPTVNLYLYHIQENHEFRENDYWAVQRHNNTATKKRPPVRVDLSYMITAWTNGVEDEHRLLSRLLMALFRHSILSAEVLQGELRGLDFPIRTMIAQPEGVMKSPADLWTALDNRLKASINYVVTLPLDLDVVITGPLVLTKVLRVHEKPKGLPEEWLQIAGTVRDEKEPAMGITGATVTIKENGISVQTDSEGRYTFPHIQKGCYTLVVTALGRAVQEFPVEVPARCYDLEL